MGDHFILYTAPSGSVLTDGLTSQGFTLHRGTRQRYPLPSSSTLSLNHKLQPFVKTTASKESRHQIHPIKLVFMWITYGSSFKTLTHYCKRQSKSYRNILNISNYSINWHKSSILPLHTNSGDVAIHTLLVLPTYSFICGGPSQYQSLAVTYRFSFLGAACPILTHSRQCNRQWIA